ncbi:MAG TPA: acyl-CoA dehydrogenase family protein [Caulobacterales bacterium]|nr:acyl-CoA dehydrogenase family protein [Caulobacterales bacterium]
MNFDFTEDQQALRDQVRRVLTSSCPMSEVRRVLNGEQAYADRAWRQLGELGFLGAAVGTDHGGAGLGVVELCVIAEEVGRALAPIPIASSIYAATTLLDSVGGDGARAKLATLASGAAIAAMPALSQIPARDVRVVRGAVSGSIPMVRDGSRADDVLVVTKGGGTLQLHAVNLSQNGVLRMRRETLDPTLDFTDLQFDDARVETLGALDANQLVALRDRLAVLSAFEHLGAAETCLEMARNYALQRTAFGRPLAQFQAIRHKLVDVYAAVTLARAHAYYGAWALARDSVELPLAAASALVSSVEALDTAAREGLHVHGGIGFTWEHDCHLFYRRARAAANSLGPIADWKARITDLLEQRNAA